MVEISEIKDTSSLEAWLGGRFREYATVMAARSALRTLPLFWDWSLSERARKSGFMALPLLKCSFTAAVSSRYPKVSMKQIGVDVSEILNARAKGISSAAWDAGYAVDSAVRLQAGHAANAAYDAVTDVFVQKFFTGEPGSGFAEARSMADASIWGNVRSDCSDLKRGIDLLSSPLWRDESPLADLWADLRPKILSAENWQPGDWRFWVEWYEQMLDPITNPPNWELLKQVALLEPEVWDAGPKDVSEAIADIQRDFKAKPAETQPDTSGSNAVGQKQTEVIAHAMVENRRALPATFDAILGYIELEIERLQRKRNYTSDAEAEEARRQAAVLSTIADAVRRLQELVPQTDAISDEAAQEAAGLGSLIQQRIKEWPTAKPGEAVDNVSDIVDGSVRSSLIGALAVGAYLIGMDATPVLLVGGTILGSQKLISRYKDVQGALKD